VQCGGNCGSLNFPKNGKSKFEIRKSGSQPIISSIISPSDHGGKTVRIKGGMFGKQLSPDERKSRVQTLFDEGYEALDRQDVRAALQAAKKLFKLNNTGAFEIEARAHWLAGRRKKAIRVLENGVKRYPQVALLWSYLGDFYSNCRLYDKAIPAFERAARGHGGRRALADYNISIALWRKGAFDEALLKVNLIPLDVEWPTRHALEALRATILVDLDRPQEALEAIEEALSLVEPGSNSRIEAKMYSVRGDAKVRLGQVFAGVEDLRRALELEEDEYRALKVLATLQDETLP
jgi:tetratricopeptide (TPR) repeat protein